MNSSANGTLLFSDWQEFGEVGQSSLSCQSCMQGAQGSDLVRLAHYRSVVTDTEISVLASNIIYDNIYDSFHGHSTRQLYKYTCAYACQ